MAVANKTSLSCSLWPYLIVTKWGCQMSFLIPYLNQFFKVFNFVSCQICDQPSISSTLYTREILASKNYKANLTREIRARKMFMKLTLRKPIKLYFQVFLLWKNVKEKKFVQQNFLRLCLLEYSWFVFAVVMQL